MSDPRNQESTRRTVREAYGQIARESGTCCCGPESSCCGSASPDAVATALGYSEADLTGLPQGANLGLSCGNPTAIASLKPGEVVVDLGSGAGFDVFIAARKVGPAGLVIGVDMTPDMLEKARANAAAFREQAGLDNVEFRLGEIEHLPVADASVDVILSNCVINLSPEKPQVYREAFRVLRPGGRLAVSDVVAVKPLPAEIRADVEAHSGCVAGAAQVADLVRILADAGFTDVQVRVKEESRELIREWFPGSGIEEFVRSADVEARRPVTSPCCSAVPPAGEAHHLDAGTKELIAIGASVSGRCPSCLTYHVAQAQGLGIAAEHIRAAVAVGQMVAKSAQAAMQESTKGAVGSPVSGAAPCCPGTTADGGNTCCS